MKGILAKKEIMNDEARLYIKKPMPIKAMQIDQTFWVESLEGNRQGKEGDYLIQDINGELRICDKKYFEENYELLHQGYGY